LTYYDANNPNWPNSIGSCNRINQKVSKTGTTQEFPSHWFAPSENELNDIYNLKVKLTASYIDGHVETYTPKDTIPIEIIAKNNTTLTFDPSPGIFFLPKNAFNTK
jgi:hypothetical protein